MRVAPGKIILKSKPSIIPNRKYHQQGMQLLVRQEEWQSSYDYYRDEDEDGLRDTETDTTSKSKDDMASFTQRMTEASSSSQALGDLLNSVDDVDGSAIARNDNASRNGTVSEPGQSTATDVDEAFLNPMDIL